MIRYVLDVIHKRFDRFVLTLPRFGSAFGEDADRCVFQDIANGGPDAPKDRAELRSVFLAELGPLGDGHEEPLEVAEGFREGDVLGRTVESIAAALSALAFEDAGVGKGKEDLLEILLRGIAAGSQFSDLKIDVAAFAPVSNQVAEYSEAVLAFGGQSHGISIMRGGWIVKFAA